MINSLLQRWLKPNAYATLRLENQRLRDELETIKNAHARHLDEVAGIQQKLLPHSELDIAGIRYAASYRPFVDAGGDYYDVVPLPGQPAAASGAETWGAIIADASGHGPAAAVEIAMLDAILRTYTGFGAGPAAVLAYINQHFFTRQIRKDFITALVINFDPDTRLLHFANAGHHPALILRGQTGKIEALDGDPGIPLGVTQGYQWANGSIRMETGDSVLLYTDGIVETRAESGEYFGIERLKSVLGECNADPQQSVATLCNAVEEFRKNAGQSDDESMLYIRMTQ